MNDCNTEIIRCKLVERLFVKLLPKHGNCLLCQQLRERRFECSGKTFVKFIRHGRSSSAKYISIYPSTRTFFGLKALILGCCSVSAANWLANLAEYECVLLFYSQFV